MKASQGSSPETHIRQFPTSCINPLQCPSITHSARPSIPVPDSCHCHTLRLLGHCYRCWWNFY